MQNASMEDRLPISIHWILSSQRKKKHSYLKKLISNPKNEKVKDKVKNESDGEVCVNRELGVAQIETTDSVKEINTNVSYPVYNFS